MSIYLPKRKNGTAKTRYYHYDFILTPVGKLKPERFCGSTSQKTKAAASKVEGRLRELAKLGKLSTLMTLKQACGRYIDEKAPKVPKRIIGIIEPMEVQARRAARKQQEHCMAVLQAYYGPDTALIAISPDNVTQAVTKRAGVEITRKKRVDGMLKMVSTGKLPSPATVNRQVVEPLRRVLRRAKKHWGVPVDLEQFQWGGEDGILQEEPEERNRELTPDEEERFWQALPPDYHLICELYIISGKRQSIWLLLPKSRVNLAEGKVYMRKLKKRREEWQWVDLTRRELEIVREAYDEDPGPYLFTATGQRPRDMGMRRPITRRMLYDTVKAALKAAGIADFKPHDFRHTFGSRAARAPGGNLKTLQRSMDHSSPRSTMRYINVRQGDVTELRSQVQVTKPLPANVARLKGRAKK